LPFAEEENSRAPSHMPKISFKSQKKQVPKTRRDGSEEHKPTELTRRECHKNHKKK